MINGLKPTTPLPQPPSQAVADSEASLPSQQVPSPIQTPFLRARLKFLEKRAEEKNMRVLEGSANAKLASFQPAPADDTPSVVMSFKRNSGTDLASGLFSSNKASFQNQLSQMLTGLNALSEQAHFKAVRDLSNLFTRLSPARRRQAFDALAQTQGSNRDRVSQMRQTQFHAEIAVLLAPYLTSKNQEIISSTLHETLNSVPEAEKIQAQIRLLAAIETLPTDTDRQLAFADGLQFSRTLAGPVQLEVSKALMDAVPGLHGDSAQLCSYCDIALSLSSSVPAKEAATFLKTMSTHVYTTFEPQAWPGSAFEQDVENVSSTIYDISDIRFPLAENDRPSSARLASKLQSRIVEAFATVASVPDIVIGKFLCTNLMQALEKNVATIEEKQANFARNLETIDSEHGLGTKVSLDILTGQSSYAGPVESDVVSNASARVLLQMFRERPANDQPALLKWLENTIATGAIAPAERVAVLDGLNELVQTLPAQARNEYLKSSAGNVNMVLSDSASIEKRRLRSLVSLVQTFSDSDRDNALKSLSDGLRTKINLLGGDIGKRTNGQANLDALQSALAFSGELPKSIRHPFLMDLALLIGGLPSDQQDQATKSMLPHLEDLSMEQMANIKL